MVKRKKQSDHDDAVRAAKKIYEKHGQNVWINPGSEKNKLWSGKYIDVIATEKKDSKKAWITEIETEESVSEAEASDQWKEYDKAYTSKWHLAVPKTSKKKAEELIKKHKIQHCKLITWVKNDDGTHTFWGLPGI